ncbi:hypothetical protein A0U40_03650 [[Bacillus] sp. KCTC 13219]|nr:hypothetical protein A0U40_03650 [[Bacillus] sp. KCTC 13219]
MKNFKETTTMFSFEIMLNSGEKIEASHIISHFNSLMPGDQLKINIIIDEADPYSFIINNLVDDLDNILDANENIENNSITIIKMEIIKNSTNSINIYNINCFFSYLKSLSLEQLLYVFSGYTKNPQKILLCFNEYKEAIFTTNLFSTVVNEKDILNQIKTERLDNLNLLTNTSGISKLNYIPEDFRVTHYSEELIELKFIFDQLSAILSVAFIADWSELTKEAFHFKILGYKKLDILLASGDKVRNPEEFFKIYRWIFDNPNGTGTIEDKLGIARNIISRYLKFTAANLTLDEDAYLSILTSYKIYLKENVEKYIETKNKIAELTTELASKTQEVNQLITNNFKQSNFTLLTYFVSLFIFNSVSFNQTTIFTKHTFVISLAVLLISGAYLFLTAYQFKKDIRANVRYFFSVKFIYKDFFDSAELNKLFNHRHFLYNIKRSSKLFKVYMRIWIVELIILLIVSIALTFGTSIKMFFLQLFFTSGC